MLCCTKCTYTCYLHTCLLWYSYNIHACARRHMYTYAPGCSHVSMTVYWGTDESFSWQLFSASWGLGRRYHCARVQNGGAISTQNLNHMTTCTYKNWFSIGPKLLCVFLPVSSETYQSDATLEDVLNKMFSYHSHIQYSSSTCACEQTKQLSYRNVSRLDSSRIEFVAVASIYDSEQNGGAF